MATDFTQDSVLSFLQSCGGSVRNSELVLHFRAFLRDHPDRVRNRELFKTFVNSVATVMKIDGVSNVVLRRKFRGHVPGGGSGRDSAEPCPPGAASSPAESPVPPGDTERKSALPAAGIVVVNQVESGSSRNQRRNLSPEPAAGPAQGGNQVSGLTETPAGPDRSLEGQKRLVSVPASGAPAVGHQDYIPQPIRGQEIPKEAPIRRFDTTHHDPIPGPMRGQQIPPQDPFFEPIRGHIVHHQDYTPKPTRRQEIPHQDFVHVPITRLDRPPQGTVPESNKGHIVSRKDHAPDPVGWWDAPPQGTVPESNKGHVVSRKDYVPEPIRGQHMPLQNPVPGPLRGQNSSSQDCIVEPFRRPIVNHQDRFPVPVRGQQVLDKSPIPAPSRRWDAPHQEPVPDSFRGNIISRVPESNRGQNVFYQDPSRVWEISSHNPVPQHLRGQQIPQYPAPLRGHWIPYQVPVPEYIRGQNVLYQDPRGVWEIPSHDPVPQPLRGQQIPYQDCIPELLKGQQIPQDLDHQRGQKYLYEELDRESVGEQKIFYQDPIPEAVRGAQNPEPLGLQQTAQNPEHQNMYHENLPEPLRGDEPQNVPAHHVSDRQSYQSAVSEDEEEEVPIRQSSAGGLQVPQWQPEPEPIRGDKPREVPARRFRHRPSYKSAVSEDDEEGVPIRQSSAPLQDRQQQPEPLRGDEPREVPARRFRHRPSYKSAVSEDDEEGVPIRQSSAPLQDRQQQPEPEPLSGDEPREVPARRFRHRQSYKSAVSEDEEEGVQIRRSSELPLNAPLSDTGRAFSASSPCITESAAPPSSSGKKVPQIYIQNSDVETLAPQNTSEFSPRLELGSLPEGSVRRSLPLEAECSIQVQKSEPGHAKRPSLASEPGPNQTQSLSSSYSSIVNPPSGSSRSSGSDDSLTAPKLQQLQQESKRAKMEPAVLRPNMRPLHQSMGNLYDERQPSGLPSLLYRSSDNLLDDQQFASRGMAMHQSTGDLYDDMKSSDDSLYCPAVKLRPSVARRTSSRLRNRICRSLGTDLDQVIPGEPGGGMDAARLERLHRISSSLSLPHHLSTSSLSSCPTPPRCPSSLAQEEGEGKKEVRRTLQPHNAGQSPVPLEAREHAWMVKAAAGAWPDIYSLFREDNSLLNRQDFISGFTVLHWIAKHGDHRVLNTLWYGVEKSGLSFNVNAKSSGGQTPLHIAATHGHKKVIRLLVQKFGADVKLRDTAGKRAWHYLSFKSPEILQLLGAPPRAALTEEAGDAVPALTPQKRRHRLRHHFSSASPSQRPRTVAQMTKVTRSSSLAAFLKHKSLQLL